MTRHTRTFRAAVAALAFPTALLAPARAAAQPVDANEVVETFLHAKVTDLGLLGILYGVDGGSPLRFVRHLDVGARTFSYATLPGQTYQGRAISLASNGFFDASADTYRWSTAGSLGADRWTTDGALSWFAASPFAARLGGDAGDPFTGGVAGDDEQKDDGEFEADAEDTAGRKYKVKGKAKKHANGTSTTSGTVTAKDNGGGTSKFTGEDQFLEGKWRQIIKVEGTKLKGKDIPGPSIKAFTTAMLESGCDDLACAGGGGGSAELTALPEPASVSLMAAGLLAIAGAGARRRRATPRRAGPR